MSPARERRRLSGLGARSLVAGAAVGAGLLAGGKWSAAGEAPSASAAKPNLIVILTDDQGYQDLGCFGSPNIRTPNIDRMAGEGMKFTAFYACAPVCSPSRAGLMTGCYPKRVGVPNVLYNYSKDGLNPKEFTIAEAAKTAGYSTMCVGKWHLGHQKEMLPTAQGFDSYHGLPYSNDMCKIKGAPGSDAAGLDKGWAQFKESSRWFNVPLMRGDQVVEQPADQTRLTDRYTDEAVKFIKENKDRPFLLYLAHSMPHVPLYVPEDRYDPDPKKAYRITIEHLDSSTGKVLDAIREAGIDKRTVVVFTSDNGPWLVKKHHGGSALPLKAGKATTMEGGMRVPCVMWAPGLIPAGKVCPEVTSNIDLLPTFAELAGVQLPKDRVIDGRSILPLMKGEVGAKSPHEAFYYYSGDKLQAVRMGKWKVRSLNGGFDQAEIWDLTEVDGEGRKIRKEDQAELVRSMLKNMQDFDKELTAHARPAGGVAAKGVPQGEE